MKKMNKILAGILACAVIGSTVPYMQNTKSFAESVTTSDTEVKTSGIFTYEINTDSDDKQITITACNTSAEGVVDIPNEIDGMPVTKIETRAFINCTKITVINIPENVTDAILFTENPEENSLLEAVNVDENNKEYSSENGILFSKDKSSIVKYPPAYKGESYTIPDTVTDIDEGAFFRNRYLKSITIPSKIERIQPYAFYCCSALENISIKYGVKSIENMAFYNCTALKEINIPISVGTIYAGAFADCTSLEKVVIGTSIISTGKIFREKGAFEGCTNLSDITFPETITYIGKDTFKDTAWFENQPKGMIYISNIAYRYKGDICPESEFSIRNDITAISPGAFENVKGIKSIIVPESVTSIIGEEFIYCDYLQSITILSPECRIYNSILVDDNTFPDVDYCSIYHGTIKGYAGSTAQTYAEENGNEFIEINSSVSTLKGDVTLDGKIDSADVAALSAYVGNPEKNPLQKQSIDNGDVHNSGDGLTTSDALMIQQYLAKVITEL